jgi:hypothetical protein
LDSPVPRRSFSVMAGQSRKAPSSLIRHARA